MNAGNDRYHLILGGNIVKIIFWAEQNNLVTDVCYIPIIYGIQRSLIVIGSITEVRRRRARFIIGWVTAW